MEERKAIKRVNWRQSFRAVGSMSGGSLPGVAAVTDDIIKSPEDERAYRVLKLENGMKVLLISDPGTDKAAAALDVNVGHLNDPWELPGLAHFCEHMLFLGTERFPDENEYHKYMADHGGSANAYTASDQTCYFFDVGPGDLTGALDRFSQFFLKPLFTESATDREVNAVDSENQNYQKNDMWRMMQVERSHSNPTHDYAKFGTGNRDTLWNEPQKRGQNTRNELLKFHEKHYSSNAMALCIVGKENLDDLTKIALDRFKDVKSNGRSVYEWKEHPWGPEQLGQRIDIIPIKDLRSLHISFPIPDLHPHYRSQPGHYISHLIGHEGPGSLLSELKRKGWVSSLSSGPREGGRGFAFFNVDVDLSEAGLEHVDDILKLVFAYIALLRREGPQEWIHKECQQLNQIRFRFKDKEKAQDVALGHSTYLHYYPEKEVLSAPYCMDEYKPELINSVMDKLRPDNFTAIVMSNKYKGSPELKKEKWYGTEIRSEKMSQKLLSDLHEASTNGDPALHLPSPNLFIPDDFSIKSKSIPVKANEEFGPEIIMDDPRTRLWHKLDREYLLPKAAVYLHFSTPLASQSPAETNLAYMFGTLLTDDLTEFSYDASLAGLHYHVENGKYGLSLNVKGYNQKLRALLAELVKRLSELKLDPARFEILKEAYVRSLRSWAQEQPYKQAMTHSNLLLAQRGWDKEQLLQAAEEELTLNNLKDFIPRLLSRLHIEALFHGNLTEEEAKESMAELWKILDGTRAVRPLPSSLLTRDHDIQIPLGGSVVYEADNPVHENSAVEVLLQTGLTGCRDNVLLELVAQLLSEPCFNTLRTKESLGYIVHSGVRRTNGTQSLRFLVQGEKDPAFVEARVELFLQAMRQQILDMSVEELETAKEALATQRLEKPKKISARAAHFWNEIMTQQYCFNRDEEEVAELRKLAKGDVLEFLDKHLALHSGDRRKLMCGVFSPAVRKAHAELDKDPAYQASLAQLHSKLPLAERVRDMTAWKMYQSTFGIPVPAKSVPPIGLPQPPKTQA